MIVNRPRQASAAVLLMNIRDYIFIAAQVAYVSM